MNIHLYDDVLQRALDTFGHRHQLTVGIEEMAEMTKVLTKVLRYGTNLCYRHNAVEEMADVLITLRQAMMVFGITEAELSEEILKKASRLDDTIRSQKKHNIKLSNNSKYGLRDPL